MKFISIKEIIAKIIRNLNLDENGRFDDYIEWAFEALQQISAFEQYEEKVAELKVYNYQAELPCDLHKIELVLHCGHGMRYIGHNAAYAPHKMKGYVAEAYYDVRFPYINTSFKEGDITVEYVGLVLDEDGLPMVLDLPGYHKAIFWYVMSMLILGGYQPGDKSINYDYADKQWAFYCGQAKGQASMPSVAQMESFKNMRMRLIPKIHEYVNGFKTASNVEVLTRRGKN